MVHEASLDFTPEASQEQQIESLCSDLRAHGRRVERLPVYRVPAWEQVAEGLVLQVGHTDYGVALAQRMHPEWWSERSPTLAVCALTMCGEFAVLEERSARVAVSAGLLHVKPSGNLQPPEEPQEGLFREALEELDLTAEDLVACEWLGLTLCHEVLLDVVYRLECQRSLEDVLARRAVDEWEHDRLLAVDCRPEALLRWCRDHYLACSPPGHAALALEGWRRYGDAWFSELWKSLPQA